MDIEALYAAVDRLAPQQRAQLLDYLASGRRADVTQATPHSEWQFDLASGAIQTTPDFDDPLRDAFWLGEE